MRFGEFPCTPPEKLYVFTAKTAVSGETAVIGLNGKRFRDGAAFRDFSGEVVLKNQELSQLPLFAHLRRNWPREEILRHVDEPNALIQLPPDFSGKFVIPERELLQGLQTANQIKRNRAGEIPARQLDFRDGAIRSARDSGEGAERRIGVPRVEHVGNGALEGGLDGQESLKLVGEGNGEEEEEEEEEEEGGEDWPENHGGRHC
nr:hypothetical protein Itr_chr15CG05230 [Ipomoea trifida]